MTKTETPGQTLARLRAEEILRQSRNEFALRVRASIPADQREAMIQAGGLHLAFERIIQAQGISPLILPAMAKIMVNLCAASGLEPKDTFDELQSHIGLAIEERLRAEIAAAKRKLTEESLKATGLLPGLKGGG